MSLFCTVCEIQQDTGRKSNFNLPHLYFVQPLEATPQNFTNIFAIAKLESLGYHMALFSRQTDMTKLYTT